MLAVNAISHEGVSCQRDATHILEERTHKQVKLRLNGRVVRNRASQTTKWSSNQEMSSDKYEYWEETVLGFWLGTCGLQ